MIVRLACGLLLVFWTAACGAAPASPADEEGPVIVPPKIGTKGKEAAEAISGCFSRFDRIHGRDGYINVRLTIEPDGRVSNAELPPGSEPWQQPFVQCVIGRLKLVPGTRDGVPVVSVATIPIHFRIEDGNPENEVSRVPKLVTTPEEAETALRACYPPDTLAMQQAQYRVTINPDGTLSDAELVESGGDPALDEAGFCMLKRLRFEPAMRGKKPVASKATIPLKMRPPR